jgi:hypothetical protein
LLSLTAQDPGRAKPIIRALRRQGRAESAARATAADRNGAAVWRSNTGALGQLANKNVAGSGATDRPVLYALIE